MKLPSLKLGQKGTIAKVSAIRDLAKRLADMGFVRGAALEMVRPGNPCIVKLESSRVALGADHQASIRLEPLG